MIYQTRHGPQDVYDCKLWVFRRRWIDTVLYNLRWHLCESTPQMCFFTNASGHLSAQKIGVSMISEKDAIPIARIAICFPKPTTMMLPCRCHSLSAVMSHKNATWLSGGMHFFVNCATGSALSEPGPYCGAQDKDAYVAILDLLSTP